MMSDSTILRSRAVMCALAVVFALAVGAETMPFPDVGDVRPVTQGPREHLLASYFAINSWSPDNRHLLVLETDVKGRLPQSGERCTIGVVDLQDGNRFIPVSTTACWNFQEAAMGHWLDDDTILFNDSRDGKFVAVVMNWRTGKELRILPRPVSAVSEDRTWAVSINYARLYLTRPDYGYAGEGQDAREDVTWPEDDGLWAMDLRTGDAKLVLSVAQGRSLMAEQPVESGKPGHPLSYYCHTAISKDGAKIFFLARNVSWYDKAKNMSSKHKTTSFTVNRDGTDLRRCFPDGWGGSHFNWAPDGSHRMLVTTPLPGNDWPSLVEFEVGKEPEVRRIGAGILDQDWHCVYSPNGKFMSGEAYPNGNQDRCWILVRLSDEMVKPLGAFHIPPEYRSNYWRCDLHARWRPDGRQLAINSVHDGSRQVYVRDVSWRSTNSAILPGQVWPDDKGVHINAHGGGILKEGDTYWWYGEDKIAGKAGNNAHTGVRAYSSADLVNWKDEGLALDVRKCTSGDLHGVPRKVERPKVLRSLSTGQYVMYFHLVREGEDYYDSRTGIAVADAPQGPFKFLKSVRPNPGKWPLNAKPEDCTPEVVEKWSAYADWIMPDWEEKTLDFIRNGNFVAAHFKKGQLAQDQTLFRDDDGKSYHIYASEFDSTVHIAELADDLLDHTGRYWRAFEGTWTEAPAVCKRNGWYYLLGSGCSGWAPNAARAYRSRSLAGPWEPLGNPCRGINPQNGLGPEKTWGCQSTFLLPDPRMDGEFIAMFDMWRPENAIDGRYVWLPVEFETNGQMSIRWRDAWNPNDKEGN